MPTYKHNDYYGYINKIQERGISDPSWFWGNTPEASEARQWLYNNGASGIIDTIYKNTPEDIQQSIPKNYLSEDLRKNRYNTNVHLKNENAGNTIAGAAATIASAPALIGGLSTVPLTTGLGLIGGQVGANLGSKIGANIGRKILSRKATPEGAEISTNANIGAALGGIAGGIYGGSAGIVAAPKINQGLKWLNKTIPTPYAEELQFLGAPKEVITQAEQGWAPKNYQILIDKARHTLQKPKFGLRLLNDKWEAGDFIKHGAEAHVYNNSVKPNTVVKIQTNGAAVPYELEGINITGSTPESAIQKGSYLAKIKSRGAYTVPQKLVGLEIQGDQRFAPIFKQAKMEFPKTLTTKQARRALTTYAATDPTYSDVHFGNIAFDGNNAWLIDNMKKTYLSNPKTPAFTQSAPKTLSFSGWNNDITVRVP